MCVCEEDGQGANVFRGTELSHQDTGWNPGGNVGRRAESADAAASLARPLEPLLPWKEKYPIKGEKVMQNESANALLCGRRDHYVLSTTSKTEIQYSHRVVHRIANPFLCNFIATFLTRSPAFGNRIGIARVCRIYTLDNDKIYGQ